MESFSNPKKWSEISKKLPGRTQHHVKNRFIRLLANEIGVRREMIRKSLNQNNFFGLLYRVLEKLRTKKNENKENKEMIQRNEKIESSSDEFESFLKRNEKIESSSGSLRVFSI